MNKKDFHQRLHRWYAAHGRHDLPWRTTTDAYAIYVSEIMLQQTQVATVRDRYYSQFLKKFPTVAALASAPQDKVLAAWQGMGYYNRALNLHKAARVILSAAKELKVPRFARDDKDSLPTTVDGLMALPGIGRNTAHAVAAFAYHQPVAVMEANVKRVLARIFAMKNPSENELWEKAELLLDTAQPFDYNQAMMDIGAMVCTKRAPRCGECPANIICEGKISPESYPAAKSKKAPPVRRKNIVVLRDAEGKYFATPRKGKFLSGLYHFGESETAQGKNIGHVRQQYSHFTLEAEVWLKLARKTSGKDWYSMKELKRLPMSMAEKKILELLCK